MPAGLRASTALISLRRTALVHRSARPRTGVSHARPALSAFGEVQARGRTKPSEYWSAAPVAVVLLSCTVLFAGTVAMSTVSELQSTEGVHRTPDAATKDFVFQQVSPCAPGQHTDFELTPAAACRQCIASRTPRGAWTSTPGTAAMRNAPCICCQSCCAECLTAWDQGVWHEVSSAGTWRMQLV